MAIVIRTLYNNQDWQAPCKCPFEEPNFVIDFEKAVGVKLPSPGDKTCSGDCWERNLCVKYRWGCTPSGRKFGKRAYLGMKAFFVHKQPDGKYALWGKTTVERIGDKFEVDFDGKHYQFMYFSPFKPLPKEKWVRNLTAQQLVGKKWLMGRHRYIDARSESYLEQLIERGAAEKQPESAVIIPSPNTITLSIQITPNINDKLEEIAYKEGRQKDEIVREAIAEWLKGREP